MAETQLCGLCTNVEEEMTFESNIFDPNQPKLHWEIEKFIGQRVLPQHICTICEGQTQTQQNFPTQIKKKFKFSEVQPLPTEELASNEIHLIKEELENDNEEDSGALSSPLPLLTQIILKDEPLSPGSNFNTEDHDEPLLKGEFSSNEIHLFKEEQENDNEEDSGALPSPLPLLTQIILKDEPLSPGSNFNTEDHDEPLLKEELASNGIHLIKEEQENDNEEDSGALPSPLPLLTQIILKDEPLSPGSNFNTEDHNEPLLKGEFSSNEINLIKEEQENDNEEDSGALPSPLPLLTQIILKDEPLSPGSNFNTEDHDEPLLKEELASNEIHLIKEEQENDNEEDSGALPSPLPLLTQIILKDEPLSPGSNSNTEDHNEPLLKGEFSSNEIHLIKEEQENDNEEDSGALPSPLPLLTQIILKDEPLSPGSNFNTEDHDEPLLKEELASNEIHLIKEEQENDNEEDSGALPSPLPLLTQIILKDEPLSPGSNSNTEDHNEPLLKGEFSSNEIHLIKEEPENDNEEDSGALPSPLPLLTQIILKDEPLSPGSNFNTEDHDEPLLKGEFSSNEIHLIKEEQENDNEEDSGALPSPLPLLTQIILKDEPLSPGGNYNTEYHDDLDNSYKPLDEDQRNSMVRQEEPTEADGMKLEEMNKAFLPSYSEVKPPKKAKSNISKREKNRQRNSIDRNCELCGKHFTLKGSLWNHMQQHKGEKKFKCDICPASFVLNANLKQHKLIHTWEFACGHCDRRFKQKYDLTFHERIHSTERPCVCPTCGKGFLTLWSLKAHMVIHTGVRAHRCETCDVAFTKRTNLLRHYRSKKHKQNVEKPPINMTN